MLHCPRACSKEHQTPALCPRAQLPPRCCRAGVEVWEKEDEGSGNSYWALHFIVDGSGDGLWDSYLMLDPWAQGDAWLALSMKEGSWGRLLGLPPAEM